MAAIYLCSLLPWAGSICFLFCCYCNITNFDFDAAATKLTAGKWRPDLVRCRSMNSLHWGELGKSSAVPCCDYKALSSGQQHSTLQFHLGPLKVEEEENREKLKENGAHIFHWTHAFIPNMLTGSPNLIYVMKISWKISSLFRSCSDNLQHTVHKIFLKLLIIHMCNSIHRYVHVF